MAVEKVDAKVEALIDLNAEIEWLGEGYGGFDADGKIRGVAEGPVWWKAGGWWNEGGFLLFSDNATNKRYKWQEGQGVSLYKEPTNDANGLTRDRQGRLIACEHASRQVTREELDGSITVVANNYRGQRLNRPNDVVVKSDGAIYFTDPVTLGVQPELDIAGVYRVSPDLGQINLLVRDFVLPNGLAFSVDEKTLYINDSIRRHIRAFDLDAHVGLGHAEFGLRPGLLRHERRPPPGRPGRHEGRCRGQRLLYRPGRHLDHGFLGRAPGHDSERRQACHQRMLWWRRLADAVPDHLWRDGSDSAQGRRPAGAQGRGVAAAESDPGLPAVSQPGTEGRGRSPVRPQSSAFRPSAADTTDSGWRGCVPRS